MATLGQLDGQAAHNVAQTTSLREGGALSADEHDRQRVDSLLDGRNGSCSSGRAADRAQQLAGGEGRHASEHSGRSAGLNERDAGRGASGLGRDATALRGPGNALAHLHLHFGRAVLIENCTAKRLRGCAARRRDWIIRRGLVNAATPLHRTNPYSYRCDGTRINTDNSFVQ